MNVAMKLPALLDWTAAAANRQEAGGKGWQLGLLARYGLPVPDGFVIPASICRAAMEAADVSARLAKVDALHSKEDALAACRDATAKCGLPAEFAVLLGDELARRGWTDVPLAVRSSATTEDSEAASFAGIHLSRLNVRGVDAVIDAVREVWASLWTPQAAAYRARFGIADAEAAMAVVVMPLLPAVAAGIAFSCDPRTGRDDQLILHAQWGLGESLVAGEADGDEYRVQEDPVDISLSLASVHIGAKARRTALTDQGTATVDTPATERAQRVLSDAQALALAELVRDAANALDFARPFYDIEWVWDGAQFWLVQARPVTAMAHNTYPAIASQPTIWSNGNTRDVMPLPQSALDWTVTRRLVNAMLEQGYRCAGYPLLPGAQRAALYNGRLHLNLSMLMWEAWDGFGVSPKVINEMAGGHQPEITVPPARLRDSVRRIPRLLRYIFTTLPVRAKAPQVVAKVEALARAWKQEALPDDMDACRVMLFDRIRQSSVQPELFLYQGSGGASLTMLVEKIEKYFPGEAYTLAASLLAGGEPSVTAQQGYELMELGALAASDPEVKAWLASPDRNDDAWRNLPEKHPFRRQFAAFLDRYGHRAVYESYWRHPRWHEAPGYLLDNIAGLGNVDVAAVRKRQEEARTQAWDRMRAKLPWHARMTLKSFLSNATRDSNQRELARSTLWRLCDAMRQLYLRIGGKLVAAGALDQPEHLFELAGAELARAMQGFLPADAIKARVADRLALRAHWEAHPAPDVIFEGAAAPAAIAREASGMVGDTWQGVSVGAGFVRAVARVIRTPSEGKRLGQGEILVAPSTDPAWTPLFLKAGGLVMETGGYLSHGAIVAREFALPAVVNLPGVLSQVRDGDVLEVDGSSGTVRLIRQ